MFCIVLSESNALFAVFILNSNSFSINFSKVLKLSKSTSTDDLNVKIINMMFNDLERFDETSNHFHVLWKAPLESLILTYLISDAPSRMQVRVSSAVSHETNMTIPPLTALPLHVITLTK